MPVYKPLTDSPILGIPHNQRNQRVLSGVDPSFLIERGAFFLETLQVGVAGVDISDGKGNVVATGILSFSHDKSPLRLDYGVVITGAVTYAKGYFVAEVFPS